MKKFKTKYIFIALTSIMLVACTKDDTLRDADNESINDSQSFVFQKEINNYIVDGKLTYDRKEITNAAKGAWNIHYDYPNNKVVISTSPATYQSYKNSNNEYKKALNESDIAARLNESTTGNSNNAKAVTLPPNYPAEIVPEFVNKNLITFYGKKVFSTTVGKVARLGHFIPVAQADLTAVAVKRSTIKVSDATFREKNVNVTENIAAYTKKFDNTYEDVYVNLNNESLTATLTRTFYEGKNYTGSSISFTVPKNGNVKIYSNNIFIKEFNSYK